MKRIFTLTAFWALLTGTAFSDGMHLVEEAFELSASQVSFSLAGAGTITVRPCRDCAVKSLPLTASTEFLVNGERMERDRFAELSRRGGAVYVFYDTQTGDVTRMRLVSRDRYDLRSRR